ncbi:MAG: methyltransferase domain-containing protein [Thermoplasmatota archaeon]
MPRDLASEVPALVLRDFGGRGGLMWPPRASDVSRILAAAEGSRVAREGLASQGSARARENPSRILDFGSGSGLLAALLARSASVVAFDPGDAPYVGRYHAADPKAPAGPFDLVVCSWMEAGMDLRAEVARFAPALLSIEDAEGGTGYRGKTSYDVWGFRAVARWSGPSFEDVQEALAQAGRGLPVRSRNRFVLWAQPECAPRVAEALGRPPAIPALPWEPELERHGWPLQSEVSFS